MKSSDLFDAMARIDESITDASEQARAVPEAAGKRRIFGHTAGLAALAAGIVLVGLITAVVVNLLPGLVGGGAPDFAETGRLSITDPYGGVPTSFSGISDDTEFGCPVIGVEVPADALYDVNGDGTPDTLFSEQPAGVSARYSRLGWTDGKTGEKNYFDGLSGGGIKIGIACVGDDMEKRVPLIYDVNAAVTEPIFGGASSPWLSAQGVKRDDAAVELTISDAASADTESAEVKRHVYFIPLGKLEISGGEARIESYFVPGEDEKDCNFVEFAGVKLWKPEFKGRRSIAALASGGGVLSAIVQLDTPFAIGNESTGTLIGWKIDKSENALELLNALTSDEEVYYSSREVPSDASRMSASFVYTVQTDEGERYYFCGSYILRNSGKMTMFVQETPGGSIETTEVSPAFFGKICNVFDKIFPGKQKWN